jgi:hypothetical protein
VSVQCHGRAWRVAQAVVAALCAAVGVAWLMQHLVAGGTLAGQVGAIPSEVAAALLTAVATAALAWRWLRVAAIDLRWDGQMWSVDGQPVALQLAMDLGGALLLRWHPAAGSRRWHWTAVSARDAGPAWHALRTALHAHATSTRDQGAAWR